MESDGRQHHGATPSIAPSEVGENAPSNCTETPSTNQQSTQNDGPERQ